MIWILSICAIGQCWDRPQEIKYTCRVNSAPWMLCALFLSKSGWSRTPKKKQTWRKDQKSKSGERAKKVKNVLVESTRPRSIADRLIRAYAVKLLETHLESRVSKEKREISMKQRGINTCPPSYISIDIVIRSNNQVTRAVSECIPGIKYELCIVCLYFTLKIEGKSAIPPILRQPEYTSITA
jgi:hypothetical protein